jgi:NitT/TauT family transport system substrate-binding protein
MAFATGICVTVLSATAVIGDAQTALVHVRLASSANDDVTPVLYAQAQGWFRQAGLDVDLLAVSNGSAVATAVASGSVDIGRSSLLPLISAHARGVPFTLIGPSGVYVVGLSTGGIVVLKDSPVNVGRDFNGKIVSVPALNDVQGIATRSWIDKNGGDSATVKFVEATGQESAVALDSARIAAATLVNPAMSQILATGKYRMVANPLTGLAPRLLEAAWFSTTDYAAQNPNVIKKFGDVLQRASAYSNEHPEQTAELLAKFSGMDIETVRHMTRDKYDLKLLPSDIQPLIDAAAKYKVIAQGFEAGDYINPYAHR